jgi:hypothetical protein
MATPLDSYGTALELQQVLEHVVSLETRGARRGNRGNCHDGETRPELPAGRPLSPPHTLPQAACRNLLLAGLLVKRRSGRIPGIPVLPRVLQRGPWLPGGLIGYILIETFNTICALPEKSRNSLITAEAADVPHCYL